MLDTTLDALEYQERTGELPRDDGLELDQLGRIHEEIRRQPEWRRTSDICVEYYDGNQLDQETLADLEVGGRAPIVTNLVKPTINVVLGMEAKTRTDWRVIADSDEWQDVAEAQSAKLHEAERESRADRACSDAFASQVKAGIGWIEVSRESDPFRYPYRVRAIHRREIYWDWLSKEPDLSDARYLVRHRWFDLDTLCAYLPKHARLIRAAGEGWPAQYLTMASEDTHLAQAFHNESRTSLASYEWREATGRVALSEVWYRRMVRGHVLRLPDDRTVELDLKNPMHQAAIASGRVKPTPAVYGKWRVSFWLGPHKLEDADYGVKRLPYIPFWGYREDITGVPYGLIRDMLSPQDEVNARARKMLWLMSAKRLRIDADALSEKHNDIADVLREISRPDAVVVTNPNRRNPIGFQVDDQISLSDQQFQVMQERKQAIQEVAGVFNAMLGNEQTGAKSGLAINSLVEQGSTTLAEVLDNYRYGRRLTGEALMDLINQDLAGREVQVVVGEEGKPKKFISLNAPAKDPQTGLEFRQNDVSRARTKVALEDVPSSPAYRAQQQVMLGEVMKSLPPNLQAIVAPMWMEATELPKRRELAEQMRKALGMVDGEMPDPEKQQMAAQIQQMAQLIEQGKAGYEEAIAKLEEQKAAAERARADRTTEFMLKAKELKLKEREQAFKERQALTAQLQPQD